MRAFMKITKLRALVLAVFTVGLFGWQSACWTDGSGGAAWSETDIYIVVHAYLDGQRTKYFRAWATDPDGNYAESVPYGDQRAFLYLKAPGQITVCARLLYEDLPKQCETITAELGIPVNVTFNFTTNQPASNATGAP